MAFRRYRRTDIVEMRFYHPGEDVSFVSISAEDRAKGSPKPGDMIARNPRNHKDQWLVAKEYARENFEPARNSRRQHVEIGY